MFVEHVFRDQVPPMIHIIHTPSTSSQLILREVKSFFREVRHPLDGRRNSEGERRDSKLPFGHGSACRVIDRDFQPTLLSRNEADQRPEGRNHSGRRRLPP